MGYTLPHMVRMRIRAMIEERNTTAYALAKTAGLSLSTIYRLTRKDGEFVRVEAGTIEKLCRVLECEPGDLFQRD